MEPNETPHYLTPEELDRLEKRHAELTAEYLETEDEETLDRIAAVEFLYWAGKPVMTDTDDPFSD